MLLLGLEYATMTEGGIPRAIIKRYAGKRLYDPTVSAYLTLEELAERIEDDENFVVTEAETGEDVTRSVLKQIIVERRRHG
jgi:polyhydroxyalkanoate synthesis repressor PhaR